VTHAPVVHIVGLGPGAPGHLTGEARELLASGLPVILRTRHHPVVAPWQKAGAQDCDDLYASGGSFEAVYEAAAGRVLEAASTGPVVYAVPGHPLMAEQSVVRLLALARERGVGARVYPAVSYVDVSASALGLDLGTVQLCDALDLRIDTWRPALISQVYDRDTVTALKLRLLDIYPHDLEVTVFGGGTADSVCNRASASWTTGIPVPDSVYPRRSRRVETFPVRCLHTSSTAARAGWVPEGPRADARDAPTAPAGGELRGLNDRRAIWRH